MKNNDLDITNRIRLQYRPIHRLRSITRSVSALAVLLSTAPMSVSAGFDIPTGAPLSPLFGAQPFEQQMLRFEEFGPMPAVAAVL